MTRSRRCQQGTQSCLLWQSPQLIYNACRIEPYLQVHGHTLSIDYTMSTLNPYTVVRMRSTFSY